VLVDVPDHQIEEDRQLAILYARLLESPLSYRGFWEPQFKSYQEYYLGRYPVASYNSVIEQIDQRHLQGSLQVQLAAITNVTASA